MGWSTTSDNGSHVDVYESSGLLTYKADSSGGGVPYCNCQEPSDFDVSIILSNGEGGECRDIEITSENEACDNEWLVTWFSGSSYSKILDDAAKEILVVKNIDDCDKVITLNNYDYDNPRFINDYRLYIGETNFSYNKYTDCGIPRLITAVTTVSTNFCENKYENNNNCHKIKYKPISKTIPTNFLVGSSALTEIYFPARFDDDKFKNTEVISAGAFSANTALSAVTFSKVKTIGEKAFSGCTNLELIDWGYCNYSGGNTSQSSHEHGIIETIGANAFDSCKIKILNFKDISSLKEIGYSAFTNCTSLTNIVFPSSFGGSSHIIGDHAFSGCSSLTSVTVNATTPPILGSGAFDGTNNCTIYVPSGSVETYKAASGWSSYATRIQPIS